jgi:hypothetical protein
MQQICLHETDYPCRRRCCGARRFNDARRESRHSKCTNTFTEDWARFQAQGWVEDGPGFYHNSKTNIITHKGCREGSRRSGSNLTPTDA